MPTVRVWKYNIGLPRTRAARTAMGGGLIAGGFLGFLPILGFWMVPAGLLVLAVDSAGIRRWNRKTTVTVLRRWNNWRRRSSGSTGAET